MLFSYLVVGSDQSQQKGRIEAISEEEARKKLNSMGLSILTISEVKEEDKAEEDEGLQQFLFSGIDEEGQEVEGEIEAEDILMAYKRLLEEFGLDLQWLVDGSLSAAMQSSRKKNSIAVLEQQAYEKGLNIKKRKKTSHQDEEEVDFDKSFLKKQKEVLENIEIIERVFKVLQPAILELSAAEGLEVEKKVDTLLRIKMSNNIEHLQELVREIATRAISFFKNHDEERIRYAEELAALKTCVPNMAEMQVEKAVLDARRVVQGSFEKLQDKFFKKEEYEDRNENENEKLLHQLKAERKEIIRLLFVHGWGILTKIGELRRKHVDAFKSLIKRFKTTSDAIENLKRVLKNIREFHAKDFGFLVDEVFFFASSLLALYIIFFSLAEISVLKSKIFSSSVMWNLVQSPAVVAFTFAAFAVCVLSGLIKEYCSKDLYKLLGAYFSILFFSTLVFYNF